MNFSHALSHNRTMARYWLPHRSANSWQRRPRRRSVHGAVDRFHVPSHRIPILLRRQAEGVADQVDQTRLDRGLRPHVADYLG